MLGHAKKTTDTTFTMFYNQVCFVHSISSMSFGWVKKTTKTTFTTRNNASPCSHNLTHFLHSIVRLAMCPRKAVPFHGILSRHGITWASSVLHMSPRSCCILVFTLQKACYTRSVCLSPRSCSISWHSFSPWHNLSKLSSAHVPREAVVSCCLPCRRLVTRVACVCPPRSVCS